MNPDTVYGDLGVSTVINAAGTKTRIGGSLMRPAAADAMREAADDFVRISDLQARASKLISELTTAEAGYVTSGASAALTLCAAACIAQMDLETMSALPDTEGVPSDIVMPRSHRNGYDHALRTAGAAIVDVGGNDAALGTGSVNTEPWEIDSAIDEETVAVGYMAKPETSPPLDSVVRIAHGNDVPVIVDAAAELPPVGNLSRFVETGADLVVFSGGKAIRGPQTTGLVAGRRDLVESIALQHLDMHTDSAVWDPPAELIDRDSISGVPRQGIGRGFKTGKEELVGVIVALEEFVESDHEAEAEQWAILADAMAERLRDRPEFTVRVADDGKSGSVPTVAVELRAADTDAVELAHALRGEDPRVFVGTDRLDENVVTLNPMCLTDEHAAHVVDRVVAHAEKTD